jgi:hypothetical protein
MPRGICWDDLPNKFYGKDILKMKKIEEKPVIEENIKKKKEFDWRKDTEDIGRRVGFGVLVCFSLI